MTERSNNPELEILELLSMDPETPELLTDMVNFEGEHVSEDTVRFHLDGLAARDLVRALPGWAADPSTGERVEACWWGLTDKGRAVVESRRG